ncbi:MAG: peptidylprolyl isomerase [Bacteroidales bacterium]|nr:peptidylprolyl isomerase [Bacteroidales bacterium]
MLKIIANITLFISLILLTSCSDKYPHALIITETDTIEFELYVDRAPVSAANFMLYCFEGRYRNASFYRAVRDGNQPDTVVKIDVLQGGLFEDDHPLILPPIRHESTKETGILHKDGVISMARNEPGTATSEYFICIGDQPALDFGGKRNPDGQGFAAFGKVVNGMDVVKRYWQMPTNGQYLDPQVRILDIILVD